MDFAVLSILNRTEVSMISIVNPIVKLEIHEGGMKSRVDVISYSNDVATLAKSFLRRPMAIFWSRSGTVQHYWPQCIFDALCWLKTNNKLYVRVEFLFPPEWNGLQHIDVPETIFDDDHDDDHNPKVV